jgi:hypothetical protein
VAWRPGIFVALPVFYGINGEGATETLILAVWRGVTRGRDQALRRPGAGRLRWAGSFFLHALRRRQPVLPHRRIDRRPIGPFQAGKQKRDFLLGFVYATPDRLHE